MDGHCGNHSQAARRAARSRYLSINSHQLALQHHRRNDKLHQESRDQRQNASSLDNYRTKKASIDGETICTTAQERSIPAPRPIHLRTCKQQPAPRFERTSRNIKDKASSHERIKKEKVQTISLTFSIRNPQLRQYPLHHFRFRGWHCKN